MAARAACRRSSPSCSRPASAIRSNPWIGNGQNLPITAEQLQQVLGSDVVKQLAARFNIPVDQLAKVLAQQLPAAVDHASPNGHLPHTA